MLSYKRFIYVYFIIAILFSYAFFIDDSNNTINFFSKFFSDMKQNHYTLLILYLSLFSILSSFFGLSYPPLIINGAILGGLYGAIISLFAITIGSYLYYLYVKSVGISNKITIYFENKFYNVNKFIKKNIFFSLIFLRIFGFGVPWIIQNSIPIILRVKDKLFLATAFLGLIPGTLHSFIADGLVNVKVKNEISLKSFLIEEKIVIPIAIFLIIFFLSIFFKKYFLKNKKN